MLNKSLIWSLLLSVTLTILALKQNEIFYVECTINNVTKIQARIVLQTNNIDIDENNNNKQSITTAQQVTSDNNTLNTRQTINGESNLIETTTAANNKLSKHTRTKKSKEKTSRRLSNIWSMFLPSSSGASDDYDDNSASAVEESSNVDNNDNEGSITATTTAPKIDILLTTNQEFTNDNKSAIDLSKSIGRVGSTEAASADASDTNQHDGGLVAKYTKPLKNQENLYSSGIDSMLTSGTNNGQVSHATLSSSNSTNSSIMNMIDDLYNNSSNLDHSSANQHQPVQLITGSLSTKDTISPSMNDIVSNIMNSMSANLNNNDKSLEKESVERDEDSKKNNNNRQNGDTNNSFERWLNKIQFEETTSTTTSRPTTPITLNVAKQQSTTERESTSNMNNLRGLTWAKHANHTANIKWPQKITPISTTTRQPSDMSQMVDVLADLRIKQQQQQQLKYPQIRSKPLKASGSSIKNGLGPQSMMIRNNPAGQYRQTASSMPFPIHQSTERFNQQQQYHLNNNYISPHPFQQHLKQQQAQLIHGIKYPQSAQASTISVSTQDGLTPSNTSLSFGQNFSFLNSLIGGENSNEMSQLINNTTPPSISNNIANNSEENGTFEQQSVYQSQDEILRQVTSAINFEQQQMNANHNNNNNKNNSTNNHRKSGEPVGQAPTFGSDDNNPNIDSISKLFKLGSNFNEVTSPESIMTTTTTQSPSTNNSINNNSPHANLLLKVVPSMQNSTNNNQSNNVLGMDDIDKSFDLLAEKLRQFAQQQQQVASNATTTTNSNNNSTLNLIDSNGGAQPSWLRKPSQNDLIAKLAAALAQQQTSSPMNNSNIHQSQNVGNKSNFEQLKDLLTKQENNKNDLKNSQDNMAILMQQLLQQQNNEQQAGDNSKHLIQQRQQQLSNNGGQLNTNSMVNLVRGETNSPVSSEQGQLVGGGGEIENDSKLINANASPNGISNIGWMPVKPIIAGGSMQTTLPLSPANLIKNRFVNHHNNKQIPMKISQLNDNIGIGKDFISPGEPGDDYYMNNLALMFASSAGGANNHLPHQAHHLHQYHLNQISNNNIEDQRIIGLPIAILKEDDIGSPESAALQLEAAAALEQQLTNNNNVNHDFNHLQESLLHPPGSINRQNVGIHNNQFNTRHTTSNNNDNNLNQGPVHSEQLQQNSRPQQQQDPNQLNQIQKILQSYSPQSFQQQQMSPNQQIQPSTRTSPPAAVTQTPGGLQPLANGEHREEPHFYHHHHHQQMNNNNNNNNIMASLINSDQQVHKDHDGHSALINNHLIQQNNSPIDHHHHSHLSGQILHQQQQPASLKHEQVNVDHERQQQLKQQPNTGGEAINKDDSFRLQKQQQTQVFLNHPANQQYQQNSLNNRIVEFPTRPNNFLTPPASIDRNPPPLPQYITTTVSNQGPPIRMKEVSLFKPFGFRTHHSIAYQASPTMAAMFPTLTQPIRPSVFRQMTPLRASFNEGHRILAPLIPQSFAEALNNRYHQTILGNNNQNQLQTLINSLPLPPLGPIQTTSAFYGNNHHHLGRFNGAGGQIKRRHSNLSTLDNNNNNNHNRLTTTNESFDNGKKKELKNSSHSTVDKLNQETAKRRRPAMSRIEMDKSFDNNYYEQLKQHLDIVDYPHGYDLQNSNKYDMQVDSFNQPIIMSKDEVASGSRDNIEKQKHLKSINNKNSNKQQQEIFNNNDRGLHLKQVLDKLKEFKPSYACNNSSMKVDTNMTTTTTTTEKPIELNTPATPMPTTTTSTTLAPFDQKNQTRI